MRVQASTAVLIALSVVPAGAPAGEATAAAAPPAAEGEDVPKPGPASGELFLLGVGVTYSRATASPGRSRCGPTPPRSP